jgi:hypothetical protein
MSDNRDHSTVPVQELTGVPGLLTAGNPNSIVCPPYPVAWPLTVVCLPAWIRSCFLFLQSFRALLSIFALCCDACGSVALGSPVEVEGHGQFHFSLFEASLVPAALACVLRGPWAYLSVGGWVWN